MLHKNANYIYSRTPMPAALQLVGNILSGDNKGKSTHKEDIKDHTAALDVAMNYLQDSYSKSVRDQVHAIGHRVVHGKDVGKAMLVTAEIEKLIKDAADLAPLHNPANMQGISAAKSIFPGQPQVHISHVGSLLLLKHSLLLDSDVQLVCNIIYVLCSNLSQPSTIADVWVACEPGILSLHFAHAGSSL